MGGSGWFILFALPERVKLKEILKIVNSLKTCKYFSHSLAIVYRHFPFAFHFLSSKNKLIFSASKQDYIPPPTVDVFITHIFILTQATSYRNKRVT